MASIFLSYARKDSEKAEAIARALGRLGHSVWWDREVEGGSRFAQKIEQALRVSEFVIVLWSRESVQSAWVQDEAAEGRDGDRLVPVLLDDSKPPLGFRQYQGIDLSRWNGRAGAREIRSVHRAILGRRRGTDSDPARPVDVMPRLRPGTLAMVMAAILAVAIVGWLLWSTIGSDGHGRGQARVRLAAFSTVSPDVPRSVPQALRDELLTALATDAKIVASDQRFGPGAGPGFLVTASVRRLENSLSFTIRLVNERSGNTLWTASIERPESIMDIAPRQVAVAASQVLRCALDGAASYNRPLPDATLTLYSDYCAVLADLKGEGLNHARAMDLARRLTVEAPDFSNAWSGFALQASIASRTSKLFDGKTVRSQAIAAARRAIRLDEDNSEAYHALALLQPDFAYSAREKFHEKAVSARPGDCGCEYVGYGVFLNEVGRNAEAADALKRAHDMLPLQADVNSIWAESLFVAGHFDRAGRVAGEVFGLWPDDTNMRQVIVRSAFWTGRHDQAQKLLADPRTPLSEQERAALALGLEGLGSGSPETQERARDALRALAQQPSANRHILIPALASLGAGTYSLALIDKELREGKAGSTYLLFEPSLEAVRRTPQFARMVQRYGLAAYWRETRHLPDFCKTADPPGLCRSL